MKKIFLSGDPTHPLYHRYQNVAAALESVFEAYEIACVSEHFETFEILSLPFVSLHCMSGKRTI